MKTSKFFLQAIEATEYNQSTGWDMCDSIYSSTDEVDTKELAMEMQPTFIKSLKIGENDVYEIQLVEVVKEVDEDGDEEVNYETETIDLIDGSSSLPKPEYMLSQYFGTHMIGTHKFRLDYAPDLTENEILLRTENSSYKWHPVELFNNEEDALQYILSRDITLVSSVIEFPNENDLEEENS